VSVQAISAALLLGDVTPGERLTAFALASYANSEQRAWPSNPVAAARAGLSRSQYLVAREGLVRRGLIRVEDQGGGRSRSSTIALDFASDGPWYDGRVNPHALEAALGYSAARGPARQLLAVLASVAEDAGVVAALTTEEIRELAGLADSTYRRARAALLRAGEVTVDGAGGRGCLNRWVCVPREARGGAAQGVRPARVAPPAGARPLVAALPLAPPTPSSESAIGNGNGPVPGGVPRRNRLDAGGVSAANSPIAGGVFDGKGPDAGGVWRKTPPKTPSETPPPHVRAWKEDRNQEPGTSPPTPRAGRGRRRQRPVTIDVDDIRAELREPKAHDTESWLQIRAELFRIVGESTFAIWLDALTLGAVDSQDALVLSCPSPTRGWIAKRFDRAFDRAGSAHGRARLADDREQQLLDALAAADQLHPTAVHAQQEAS
jgi:hypothetical protein